jgi:hypothetical protein
VTLPPTTHTLDSLGRSISPEAAALFAALGQREELVAGLAAARDRTTALRLMLDAVVDGLQAQQPSERARIALVGCGIALCGVLGRRAVRVLTAGLENVALGSGPAGRVAQRARRLLVFGLEPPERRALALTREAYLACDELDARAAASQKTPVESRALCAAKATDDAVVSRHAGKGQAHEDAPEPSMVRIFQSAVDTARKVDSDGEGSARSRVRLTGPSGTERPASLAQVALIFDLARDRRLTFKGEEERAKGQRLESLLAALAPGLVEREESEDISGARGGRPAKIMTLRLKDGTKVELAPFQSPHQENVADAAAVRAMRFQPID